MPLLKRIFDNLTKPPDEIRSENLSAWIASLEGVTPLERLEPRKRQRAAGVVQNLRIDPREGRDSVEATIIDGSGRMIVKWLGRSSLQGIGLGVGLIVEGIVGESDGLPMILNPDYDLIHSPEHG